MLITVHAHLHNFLIGTISLITMLQIYLSHKTLSSSAHYATLCLRVLNLILIIFLFRTLFYFLFFVVTFYSFIIFFIAMIFLLGTKYLCFIYSLFLILFRICITAHLWPIYHLSDYLVCAGSNPSLDIDVRNSSESTLSCKYRSNYPHCWDQAHVRVINQTLSLCFICW